MARQNKPPKSDSNDVSVGNIANVTNSIINIGNGSVNSSQESTISVDRDEKRKEENKGKMKKNSITLLVAIIGGLAICIAALIGLFEPVIQWIVDNYLHTATPVTQTLEPPLTISPSPDAIIPQNPLVPEAPPIDADSGQTWESPKDKMTLVYVPAGEFLMGADDHDSIADADEKPPHKVYLDSYWIDQTEVTNTQYALCEAAGECRRPLEISSSTHEIYYGNSEFGDYPVIYVSWNDADDYCAWAGRQLPTEAQWEKAARGTDERIYPWGNNLPNHTLANYETAKKDVSMKGSYPSGNSYYGVMDIAGNVWEWTADWYNKSYYDTPESLNNPTGPIGGDERVKRGGSWGSSAITIRTTYRDKSNPLDQFDSLGFRCVYMP